MYWKFDFSITSDVFAVSGPPLREKAQIPEPERWRDDSGLIEVPDNVIWCRKGSHENDFGAYYYASYILPGGPQFGGRFFI